MSEATKERKELNLPTCYAVVAKTRAEKMYMSEYALAKNNYRATNTESLGLPLCYCFRGGKYDGWMDRLDRAISYVSFEDFILHNVEGTQH